MRTWDEDHTVCGDALMLSTTKLSFRRAGLIHQQPPQSEARGSTLSKAQPDEIGLASEDFHRELTAVFPSHRPLHSLHD